MSPSSSVPQHPSVRKIVHSRQPSGNVTLPDKAAREPVEIPPPAIQYTCFIRLPFPRGDFEDPPQVEWDAAKDRALWKVISKASNSKEINWEDISAKFDVSLPFLLQQAAWLYERHFASMKAQMKKLGASGLPSPALLDSTGNSTPAVGGEGMRRTGSRESKAPSAISNRKDSPLPTGEMSMPGTPKTSVHPLSRTPSTTTVTQSRVMAPPSPRQPLSRASRTSGESQRRTVPPLEPPPDSSQDEEDSASPGDEASEDSSSEEEDEQPNVARSQAFRRLPVTARKLPLGTLSSDGEAEDDEDDDSGGYLPFAAASKSTKEDPSATLRNSPKRQNVLPQPPASSKGKARQEPFESSASSASSAAPSSQAPSQSDSRPSGRGQGPRPGPLSPQRKAELAKLSPRTKKDASDGTPSMGSSFSDLDDASVTQSALEDALLSNIQQGRMGSRMSTISNALKSKYL